MLSPSSNAHYGLQVLIALAHGQRTQLLTEAFLPAQSGHLRSWDGANRLRPARVVLRSSLTSPENRSPSWGGSCHSLSCFTDPRLPQDSKAQENSLGCFLTRAAFMEIKHLPHGSGSPCAAGISTRLFASLPGVMPDVSARCDSEPPRTETLAKIPPGWLRRARQLCPGLRRQTPAVQGRGAGRGADPLPATSSRFASRPSHWQSPKRITES